jgi:hypothetical protein
MADTRKQVEVALDQHETIGQERGKKKPTKQEAIGGVESEG